MLDKVSFGFSAGGGMEEERLGLSGSSHLFRFHFLRGTCVVVVVVVLSFFFYPWEGRALVEGDWKDW